ncbi:MAG: (deoxy)nucleoside triphosphate pyrophosphohydrolase [Firmicutes bacterium]|nr:(deoxy)nucleoside triphosphate pyrophosphohydrolase [Bacillota bacterium]
MCSQKEVTAAIIEKNGKILIAQRATGGSEVGGWEFPGGKIEPGETPEECLARELWEEFGIKVQVGEFFTDTIYNYGGGSIHLLAYWVHWNGKEELELRVHETVQWVEPGELLRYRLLPADVPIAQEILKRTGVGRTKPES